MVRSVAVPEICDCSGLPQPLSPERLQGLGETRCALKDGGRVGVSLKPKEKMKKFAVTDYDFRLYDPPEVGEWMGRAGFRDVRVAEENWEGRIIPVRSGFSRFSRGTI